MGDRKPTDTELILRSRWGADMLGVALGKVCAHWASVCVTDSATGVRPKCPCGVEALSRDRMRHSALGVGVCAVPDDAFNIECFADMASKLSLSAVFGGVYPCALENEMFRVGVSHT